MNDEWLAALFLGIVLGVILSLALYVFLEPIRIEIARSLGEPDTIYEVTVDDLAFHCVNRPLQRNDKLRLVGCKESYGRTVIIRSYTSYSIRVNKDG